MLPDSANLTNLARRWRSRLIFARSLEAMFCLALGVTLADCVVLVWPTGMNRGGHFLAEPSFLWLFGPPAVAWIVRIALGRWGRINRLANRSISATIVGWVLAVVMLAAVPPAGQGDVRPLLNANLLAIAAGVILVLAASRPTPIRVSRWLDDSIGSHLLLTTAGQLLEQADSLSEVETAVVSRANQLAGRKEAFAGVSPWAIRSWRTWTLLPIAMLAAGVAGMIGAQLRETAKETALNDKQGGEAQRNYQQPSLNPIVAAMIDLANQQAGSPLAPVLLKPNQSADQLSAAVAAQVKAWQEDRSLTVEKRKELADQLRAAADRIRAADPEAALRLDRAADALAAGDWPRVAAEMAELARQIQPIVAAAPVPESAVRKILDRLRTSSSGATTGPENPGPTNSSPYASAPPIQPAVGGGTVSPPTSALPIDPSVRENLSKLPVDQQEVVRRYFAIEK